MSKIAYVLITKTILRILVCSKDHTSWANQLLKRGKRRLISDIRRSVGDGQTLVYLLETLGKIIDHDIIPHLYMYLDVLMRVYQLNKKTKQYEVARICMRTLKKKKKKNSSVKSLNVICRKY